MIVSVILDSEYMGMGERFKWFLKNVTYAKKNNWVIVTHEYIRTHLEELLNDCDERFYDEFEMERATAEEINELDICYIPDDLFEEIYHSNNTRTNMILDLSNNRKKKIEDFLISHIDRILADRNDKKVEFIFNCIHTFASIRYISEYYGCPLIPYVFSAIRKVHGYTQTLYMAHMDEDLFKSKVPEKLYDLYRSEDHSAELLTRQEIMAVIGKRHNLILLPLMQSKGKYEMGVIREAYQTTPQLYQTDTMTDDDIYYEFDRCFNDHIQTRMHPMQLDRMGAGRNHLKNDPAAFILGCKRLATVHSQMIVKAALWNRATCILGDQLPYSFLLSHDFTNDKPMDEFKLNFLIFCYFIPDKLMFDEEYWKWRRTEPDTSSIVEKHMQVIFENIGMKKDMHKTNGCLKAMLIHRQCSEGEINVILHQNNCAEYPPEYPSSKMKLQFVMDSAMDIYSLNVINNGWIESEFDLSALQPMEKFDVYLMNDVDGTAEIQSVMINGCNRVKEGFSGYRAKNQSQFTIYCSGEKIEKVKIVWKAKSFDQMMQAITAGSIGWEEY